MNNKLQGKRNRARGQRFELKVRKDLKSKGWIVDRWSNQVEWLEDNINKPPEKREGKLVKAKSNRFRMRTTGFPDFVCFKLANYGSLCHVVGVEVKSNGILSKIEKEKCKWLLDNKIFSKIFIASNKDGIVYREFK